MRSRIFWIITALVLALMVLSADHYAQLNYLYWRYPWSDAPIHLLGGLAVGCFAIGVFTRFRPLLYSVFALLLFVGWEFFEYSIGATHVTDRHFTLDTSFDLLMDVLGALIVYVIARYTLWASL